MNATELMDRIGADSGLSAALAALASHQGSDPSHDIGHCLRVAWWTLRLGGADVDAREALAAALLHDIVNLPKDSPERSQASRLSAEMARRVLAGAGFSADALDRIARAIEDHSYSRGVLPRGPLGCALQDADRLEALGALGILRAASCGVRLGAQYYEVRDPWATARSLDDRRFTLDHFFVKLLRLEATMCTDAGRREAHRRTVFMRAFLAQLGDEIGETPECHGPSQRR